MQKVIKGAICDGPSKDGQYMKMYAKYMIVYQLWIVYS